MKTLKYLYVYILKCSDNTFYTGITNNMDLRLTQHNKGRNCNSYTYSRRPVELKYCELFTNFNLAIEWETRIKKWSSKKKIALINSDWKSLIEESRNTIEKLKLLEENQHLDRLDVTLLP